MNAHGESALPSQQEQQQQQQWVLAGSIIVCRLLQIGFLCSVA
jgi:hypothetical protein